MGKFIDLTGQVFGRLTVIKRLENDKWKKARWLCKCECGNMVNAATSTLRKGHTRSCGCLKDGTATRKHGKRNTRLYRIWCGMKQRCYNPKADRYKYYGARGIKICTEWKNDFMSFYNWAVSNGYSDELSIDRIDNDGNYEPSNCKWETQNRQVWKQSLNSRNTSGVRGVSYHKRVKKYCAIITINEQRMHLGYFETIEGAARARKEAEKKYYK